MMIIRRLLKLRKKEILIIFLFFIFLLNILQSFSLNLLGDEAYYWAYSNYLDWGYFDHPPMVALWIAISKFVVSSGELSVRFFSAITTSITFYICWLLVHHKEKEKYLWLFILVISSFTLINVYGFITVPDTPLLFFMALFLLGYQKYLDKKSLLSYLIIVLSVVGMIYSKYQSVLIVFFVLVTNLKVLKDYKIWLSILLIVLCYIPHLHWQYVNEFVSFKYHLSERISRAYNVEFTIIHFVNMIAIAGFTFPVVYYSFFKHLKVKTKFEQALNWIIIGFFFFFLLVSFKTHTQIQWVVPVSIPLIIIVFKHGIESAKSRRIFTYLSIVSIVSMMALRVLIVKNETIAGKIDIHGKKWVADLCNKYNKEQDNFLFKDSYQRASLFWFYSGKQPLQYNSWYSRKNQFSIFEYNKVNSVKDVIHVQDYKSNEAIDSVFFKENHKLFISKINNYTNLNDLKVVFKEECTIYPNSINHLEMAVHFPEKIADFNTIEVKVVFRDKNKSIIKFNEISLIKAAIINNTTLSFDLRNLEPENIPDTFQLIAKIKEEDKHEVRISDVYKINYKL